MAVLLAGTIVVMIYRIYTDLSDDLKESIISTNRELFNVKDELSDLKRDYLSLINHVAGMENRMLKMGKKKTVAK